MPRCSTRSAQRLSPLFLVLSLAGADNHFHSEWHSQLIDLLDGEPHELYLVRAPAGPTRALLQRQASLLREEADSDD